MLFPREALLRVDELVVQVRYLLSLGALLRQTKLTYLDHLLQLLGVILEQIAPVNDPIFIFWPGYLLLLASLSVGSGSQLLLYFLIDFRLLLVGVAAHDAVDDRLAVLVDETIVDVAAAPLTQGRV